MTPKKDKIARIPRAAMKAFAGMVSTTPQDFIRLAAHAGDQMLKGESSQALVGTYNFFMNKGEIDPKYLESR